MDPQPDEGEINVINLGQLSSGVDVDTIVRLTELSNSVEAAQRLLRLRDVTTFTLLLIFTLGNLSALSLFFLNGIQVTMLSDTAMASLAAATIAEVSGLIAIIVKGLFV